VPLAVGIFLLWRMVSGTRRVHEVLAFAAGAALPLIGLLLWNMQVSRDMPVTAQFNLGSQVATEFTTAYLVEAWGHFSRQSLYAHRPEAAAFFAWGLPLAALAAPLVTRRPRRRWLQWVRSPGFQLSASAAVALLAFLVLATTFFSAKFNYVGLARYYQPVRPLYFVLLFGCLLCYRDLLSRSVLCIALLAGCSWFIRQDAYRDLRRWQLADRPTTAYGRWATRFEPNSRALYGWIAARATPRQVIFSNFHDDIALETQVPACPLPRNRQEMDAWLPRIRAARGVGALEVLFVLDPDNRERGYYLPPHADVIAAFGLERCVGLPEGISRYVYRPAGRQVVSRGD
jgi:hypothetical protein